ncbi:acyl-CoA dehydrogenase family protein [Nocardia altamirensis]|uniref:acyl-CoA dehydrogenase family protein n=1 Tax=Nocardia altamirensis TaxID=472158 RepID=UPI0014355C03|nr:acyl-CoA dehydrogenase family protein [Nocardia altamirensis]
MTSPHLASTSIRVAEIARALADQPIDRDELPAEVVAELRATGLYRLCLPAELGGHSLPLPETVSIIERLSYADGSTGWCTVVANVSASLLAGVAESEARLIAADPESLLIAGGFPPIGQAEQVGDSYRLSGRWPFASGCLTADWFLGGVMVAPVDGGAPAPRVAFFPASEARIIRNWDVIGLRATGSHDVAAEQITVPMRRTTTLFGGPRWSNDPIAAIPFFALSPLLAAVPLGIAQRAVDELGQLATTRVPLGQRQSIAHDPAFQDQLGTVLARLGALRAYLLDSADTLWHSALTGAVTPPIQASTSMVAAEAIETALAAVHFAHRAGGTTSIRNPSVLTRCLNDVLAASRHAVFRPTARRNAARALLGLPLD